MPGPRPRARRLALPVVLGALLTGGCGGAREEETSEAPPRATTTTRPTTTTSSTATTSTTSTTAAPRAGHVKTYVLYWPSRWEVGDVFTNDVRNKTTTRAAQVAADGSTSPLADGEQSIEAGWLEKCTHVDGDGRCARAQVSLSKWTRRSGEDRDESLQGSSIVVTATGAGRRWSLAERKNPLTAEARKWLDEHFGVRAVPEEQWLRIMLPDQGVAVGESWSPDPALLAGVFKGGGMDVDPSTVAATVTLTAADEATARCRFKIALPLRRVPNSQEAWSTGGTFNVTGEMTLPFGTSVLFPAKVETQTALEGEAAREEGAVRYSVRSEDSRTRTQGGTFPEPPSP
jgi:hypothetical protein